MFKLIKAAINRTATCITRSPQNKSLDPFTKLEATALFRAEDIQRRYEKESLSRFVDAL